TRVRELSSYLLPVLRRSLTQGGAGPGALLLSEISPSPARSWGLALTAGFDAQTARGRAALSPTTRDGHHTTPSTPHWHHTICLNNVPFSLSCACSVLCRLGRAARAPSERVLPADHLFYTPQS
ncbi:hypothetical protein AAFF_G00300320, partial [Aldrovandia affinis]